MKNRVIILMLVSLVMVFSMGIAEETWNCPTCNTRAVTTKFCPTCGTMRPTQGWICSKCGTENNGNFCVECGTKREDPTFSSNDEGTDLQLTLSVFGNDRAGKYTGNLQNGLPHGKGKFISNVNGDKFTYDGEWTNGEIKGKGYIEADSFTIHFDNEQGQFERVGQYKGDLLDGLPDGSGLFKTANSAGTKWEYTGAWKDGFQTGYGSQTWYSDTSITHKGNYDHGNFLPTWSQFLYSNGTYENFQVSEKSLAFLEKNGKYFPTNQRSSIPSSLINRSFNISQYKKNSSPFEEKFIEATGLTIVHVIRDKNWGRDYEQAILQSKEGDIYFGYFDGKTNLEEGMRIDIKLLPLDYSTYENTEGTQLWAVFCAYSNSYEDSYTTLRTGDSGTEVLEMKFRLQELGYFKKNASFGLDFNATTAERVMIFQSVNNLPVTGVADSATLRMLYSSSAKSNPSPF